MIKEELALALEAELAEMAADDRLPLDMTQLDMLPIIEKIIPSLGEFGKKVMQEAGYIMEGLWTRGDVIHTATGMGVTLTSKQVDDVIGLLGRRFDAELGMCWETIQARIEEVLEA